MADRPDIALSNTTYLASAPTRIIFGAGVLRTLGDVFRGLSAQTSALRHNVKRAAQMAGLTIVQGLTTLSRADSYRLTLLWGLPHGHACTSSLGALLAFNAGVDDDDCNHPGGAARVPSACGRLTKALGTGSAAGGRDRIEAMIRGLVFATFRRGGFDRGRIASEVMQNDRFRNNPRAMSREQLDAFLAALS